MFILYLSTYEDGTECYETSEYEIQTPGNYPEKSIQHSEHSESLKSRIIQSSFSIQTAVYLSRPDGWM